MENEKMEEVKSRISIVTGFFDCGRGDRTSQRRTVEQYLNYFKFWARLRNHLVVYVSPEYAEKIKAVREQYDLLDRTDIVVIDDIYAIEPELLDAMRLVEKRKVYSNWRYRPDDISNNAEYDYIMLMKYWMMKDAVEKGLVDSGMIAWMDFGWNHGGQVFANAEEFDFTWDYRFDDKINLFSLKDISEVNGFVQLQYMNDSIMGAMLVLKYSKCDLLYLYCKEALKFLLAIDCFDDDQMLLFIAARLHPGDFTVSKSGWFLPIKEFGNSHLSIKKEAPLKKVNILKRGLSVVKRVLYPGRCIYVRDRNYYYMMKNMKQLMKNEQL